jgi:hypothetical protein
MWSIWSLLVVAVLETTALAVAVLVDIVATFQAKTLAEARLLNPRLALT